MTRAQSSRGAGRGERGEFRGGRGGGGRRRGSPRGGGSIRGRTSTRGGDRIRGSTTGGNRTAAAGSTTRGGRIEKPKRRQRRSRPLAEPIDTAEPSEAVLDSQGGHEPSNQEATQEPETPWEPDLEKLKLVLRQQPTLSYCSDGQLAFISRAGLATEEDTNTITLNLMDHFLFSNNNNNWLPELSYTRLHAACFLLASRLTGKEDHTVEKIAEALGPESDFIQELVASWGVDEATAAEIQYIISVVPEDVEEAYGLLYERRDQLGELVGQYAVVLVDLPKPWEEQAEGEREEEDGGVEEYLNYGTSGDLAENLNVLFK